MHEQRLDIVEQQNRAADRIIAVDVEAALGVMMVVVAPLAINPRQIETSATVYAVFAIE